MKINYDRFCLSHCLDRHPLLAEKTIVRLKYLNVLAYFIEKYADKKDVIARAAFENYKTALMYVGGIYERLEQKKDGTALRYILKYKLRNFKFFSFRYVLLCDLVMLICPLDESTAHKIADEIKTNLKKASRNNIDFLLQTLFHGDNNAKSFRLAEYHLDCWDQNKSFQQMQSKKVMVSSNMSSGKSTLINALVGKRINRSMNEACTSKLHYIYDKPFEDNFIHEYDYDLEMNADIATLMDNNKKNKENIISVASYFRFTGDKGVRLCVIDSPGVNNSLDTSQEEIKKLIAGRNFNVFLYVINAEYIGTTDDFVYLEYIKNNIQRKPIVFVVNKLDRFRLVEDSIEESINKIRERLASLGFTNPIVCPISAYTGYMAKRKLFDNDLSEDNLEEYELLSKKFKKIEYDLSKYYDPEIRSLAKRYVDKADENTKNELALLYNGGLLCLETLLQKGEQ